MTHPAARFPETHHHPATTAALVVLFWLAAASVVAAANLFVGRVSPLAAEAIALAGIVAAAFLYTRLCARCAGFSHALGVGSAWLVLAIVSELALTARLGHAWTALLGAPDRPLLRNLFLFAWIFAPALFARREDNA